MASGFYHVLRNLSLSFARKQALVLGRPGIRNLPISVVSRSSCRLLYKYEKSGRRGVTGKEQTLSKILAISQHAMQAWCWKSKRGQDTLEQRGVAWPRKQTRTTKLLLSENKDWILLWKLTFGFATMISVNTLKAKNVIFVVLPWR